MKQQTNKLYLASVAIILLAAGGCANCRYAAVPKVQDIGSKVTTQNRYRLEEFRSISGEVQNITTPMRKALESNQPRVFSANGIPIGIQIVESKNFRSSGAWSILFPYLVSLGTLPAFFHNEHDVAYAVYPLRAMDSSRSRFAMQVASDESFTFYSPFALLCFNGPPDGKGYRSFYYTAAYGGESDSLVATYAGIAYGAAVTLKEMENAGLMKSPPAAPAAPPAAPAAPPAAPAAPLAAPTAPSPTAAPAAAPAPTAAPVAAPAPAAAPTPQIYEIDSISI